MAILHLAQMALLTNKLAIQPLAQLETLFSKLVTLPLAQMELQLSKLEIQLSSMDKMDVKKHVNELAIQRFVIKV